ncbi:MAG: ABC transporter permease subunit [Bdellovibrionales bacterium]|nr:ABC transporter permease subunit [Bdellovibrionales bacterium]
MSFIKIIQKHFLPVALILSVSFPFIVFLLKVKEFALPEYSKIISCFSFTFFQAFLSVVISWFFALPASLGLTAFYKRPFYSFLEWAYLLPLFLPPLVIAGSIINIFEYISINPFGLTPIVLGHAITYAGGMAVILARLLMSKTASYCEWAVVHGLPLWKLLTVLLRFVLKRDVQLISLTVFCFCLTSFSLPLLLGGDSGKTLEVVIYDYLKNPNEWPIALGLLSIEILCIFILSFFIFKPISYLKKLRPLPYTHIKKNVLFGLLPICFIIIGFVEGLYYIPEVLKLTGFMTAVLATLFLSLSVGAGIIFCFILISFYSSISYLKKFLIGYAIPSIVLTGFSFLIFMNDQVYMAWICGLIILFLPSLYRWAGESFLYSLENQIQTAQTLGADKTHIFKKIIWPQCAPSFFLLGGIAGFWASGDFAYTMITSQGNTNLAITAQQLLERYRTEQGLALIWILLFIGSLCFLFFRKIPSFIGIMVERK